MAKLTSIPGTSAARGWPCLAATATDQLRPSSPSRDPAVSPVAVVTHPSLHNRRLFLVWGHYTKVRGLSVMSKHGMDAGACALTEVRFAGFSSAKLNFNLWELTARRMPTRR